MTLQRASRGGSSTSAKEELKTRNPGFPARVSCEAVWCVLLHETPCRLRPTTIDLLAHMGGGIGDTGHPVGRFGNHHDPSCLYGCRRTGPHRSRFGCLGSSCGSGEEGSHDPVRAARRSASVLLKATQGGPEGQGACDLFFVFLFSCRSARARWHPPR